MLLTEYKKTNKPKTIIYRVERTLCPDTLTEYNDLIWVTFTKWKRTYERTNERTTGKLYAPILSHAGHNNWKLI